MNDFTDEQYVEYHEYLVATVVLLVLGGALFLAGFVVGMDGLLVEHQDQWFRVEVLDHRFITGPAVAAIGATLMVFATRPYVHAKQLKEVGYTYEVVR